MARAALGLSIRKFADAARVAPLRERRKVTPRTVISLQKVLEAAGVEFTDGRKPGVRLNMR
jgi:hypothetical protein